MKKIVLRAFLLFLLCVISFQTVSTNKVGALADDATSTGNTPSCSSLGLSEKIKEGDHNGISIPSPADFQITVLSRSELLIQTTSPSKTFFAAGGSPTYGEIFGEGCIVSDPQLDSAFTWDDPDAQFFTVDRLEWSDGTNMGNAFDDIEYGLGQFNTSALSSMEIRWVFQNSDNFSTNEYIYFLDPYWYYSSGSSSDPANENGTHGITVTNILNKELLNHILKVSGSPGNVVLTTSPSLNPRTFSQGNAPSSGTLANRVVFYRNLANGDDGVLALPAGTTIEAFLQATDFVDMEYYESLDDTSPQIVPVLGGAGQEALNSSIPEGAQGGTLSTRPSCETAANWAFGFVVCPLLDMADRAIGWLDNRIISSLSVNDAYYENSKIRDAWGNVRNIALILLIPVMLLMVIGTALQLSFVDPYTVKRALPRLFVAIIFIAVSYDICALMIQVTNEIGKGVAGIITSPFGGLSELTLDKLFANGQTGDTALFAGGVLAGIGIAFMSGVTIWTLFSFVGMGALALLIIFVLLSVRELMIVFLLVVSPIAIIAWIFPGNDKGWKLWWGTFSKLLLIYPIIMAFLGMGRAFATIVGEAGGDAVVSTIVKLVAFIGPYFFIPKAFQMAGGAFANLAGMVNDRGKGIFDRQRKYRADARKNKRARISSNRPRSNNAISRRAYGAGSAIFAQADAVKKDGLRRGLLSGAAGDSRRAAEKRQRDEERQHAEKDPTLQQNIGNDQFGEVLLQLIDNPGVSDENLMRYLQAHNYSETGAIELIASARSLHSDYGHALAGTALMGKVGSNTSYTGGEDQLLDDIIRAGHGSEADMMALLGQARATAANKGLFHLSGGSYGEDAAMLQALLRVKKNNGEPLTEDIEYTDEVTGERGVLQTAGLNEAAVRELINNRKEEKARASMQSWDFSRIHATSARKLAGSLHQEVQRLSADASSETDPGLRAQKMRAVGQKIAQIRSIQTSISQSSSQEVKEIFADALDNADGSQSALNVGGDSYSSLSELVSIPTQIHGDMEDFVRTNGEALGPRDAQTVNDLRALTGGYRSTSHSAYDGMSDAQRRAIMEQQNGPN